MNSYRKTQVFISFCLIDYDIYQISIVITLIHSVLEHTLVKVIATFEKLESGGIKEEVIKD